MFKFSVTVLYVQYYASFIYYSTWCDFCDVSLSVEIVGKTVGSFWRYFIYIDALNIYKLWLV